MYHPTRRPWASASAGTRSTLRGLVRAVIPAALLCVAQLAAPGIGSAQQAPFAGRWDVTWDQAIRTAGDRVLKVQRRGTAVLILEQHADSLEGTWRITGTDQTHRVVGTVRGDSLSLHAPDATMRDGGRAFAVTMRWYGLLEDGEIAGTMYLRIQGGDAPPRAWEAVRRPGEP